MATVRARFKVLPLNQGKVANELRRRLVAAFVARGHPAVRGAAPLMSAHSYHFVSRWRVEGLCGEVADVIGDPLALPRWWPSVYLRRGRARAARRPRRGRRVRLLTKGWLPYTLRWEFVVVESRYPNGFTLAATGDFEGRGVWTFEQDGAFVDVTYDWRIEAREAAAAAAVVPAEAGVRGEPPLGDGAR